MWADTVEGWKNKLRFSFILKRRVTSELYSKYEFYAEPKKEYLICCFTKFLKVARSDHNLSNISWPQFRHFCPAAL